MRFPALLILAFLAHAVAADDLDVTETLDIKTYNVTGTTLAEVESQLERKGPRGFWAFTDVRWRWDARCNVTLDATITMPNLRFRDRLTDAEQAEWDRMHAALLAHEMEHVDVGRETTRAIKAANCKVDSNAIQARTRRAMVELDARTNHGINTGATLRFDRSNR